MSGRLRIEAIPAHKTHDLRARILRAHQQVPQVRLPGDDAPGAIHLGAFEGDRLVGVVSLTPEPFPEPLPDLSLDPAPAPQAAAAAADHNPTTSAPAPQAAAAAAGPQRRTAADAGHHLRLRGMAVEPDQRGRGVGRLLLAACREHVASSSGGVIWCNARTTAAGFYERDGFRRVGGEFDMGEIGPHVRMITHVAGG